MNCINDSVHTSHPPSIGLIMRRNYLPEWNIAGSNNGDEERDE